MDLWSHLFSKHSKPNKNTTYFNPVEDGHGYLDLPDARVPPHARPEQRCEYSDLYQEQCKWKYWLQSCDVIVLYSQDIPEQVLHFEYEYYKFGEAWEELVIVEYTGSI